MLTNGETWYGKRGFIPFNPLKQKIDIEKYASYKLNRKLVDIIKVKHVEDLKELLKKANNILKIKYPENQLIDYEKLKTFIANNKNVSIRKFMKDFAKLFDVTCGYCSLIYKDIMKNIGLVDLHQTTYFLPFDSVDNY